MTSGVDVLGSAGILKVNADGTIQRIVPRITPFEAPSTADVAVPFGSKAVVPGTTVTLSPSPSALSAFVLAEASSTLTTGNPGTTGFVVCELQLNGVARPEFAEVLGPVNAYEVNGVPYALALAPGSVNTIRLAVWKSNNDGAPSCIHPHTKLAGVLVEVFLS